MMKINHGIGDVVVYLDDNNNEKKETIWGIGWRFVGDGWMDYNKTEEDIYTEVTYNDGKIYQSKVIRVAMSLKFKRGQLVNSFHYNDNMRSTTFETGVVVRYLSEKIVLVNFAGSKRQVEVSGLEPYGDHVYYVGTTQTRIPLELCLGTNGRCGVTIRETPELDKGSAWPVCEIEMDKNGSLRINDGLDNYQSAASTVMIKALYKSYY